MSKSTVCLGVLFLLSFLFLIVSLNYNVKTFKLTQQLQDTTLDIQQLEYDVKMLELDYYSKIKLNNVYKIASETLGMIHQSQPLVFSNKEVHTQ